MTAGSADCLKWDSSQHLDSPPQPICFLRSGRSNPQKVERWRVQKESESPVHLPYPLTSLTCPTAVTSCKPLHYRGHIWAPDSMSLKKQSHNYSSSLKSKIWNLSRNSIVCQWMELKCQTLPMPLPPDHTNRPEFTQCPGFSFLEAGEIKCAPDCWVYKELWNPWNWVVWSKTLSRPTKGHVGEGGAAAKSQL